MENIIVYPNFAGVDVNTNNGFDYPVKNVNLNDLIPNEKFKEDEYFKSVDKQKKLEKMKNKINDLPPILVIKHPLKKGKFSILDGHHRFQLFKKLDKKSIPSMIIGYDKIYLSNSEYGGENTGEIRLDKVSKDQIDLSKYFNTEDNGEDNNLSPRSQFAKDLQSDPDFIKHKKRARFSTGYSTEFDKDYGWDTFGTVNLGDTSKEDPFVKNEKDLLWVRSRLKNSEDLDEKWSEKYKKSIDCNNPKGFSQKAHCQGKKKKETKESMGADSAGSYEGPMNVTLKKKDIDKINNWNQIKEALDASASGEYDVPYGGGPKGRKDPLKIGGPKTIQKRINKIKGRNFPKWGGPDSKFIEIKDKCKKFPYCNQGDMGAIKVYNEAIDRISKKYGISESEIIEIVLNQFK
jgi:hypothetical protein